MSDNVGITNRLVLFEMTLRGAAGSIWKEKGARAVRATCCGNCCFIMFFVLSRVNVSVLYSFLLNKLPK